MSDQTSVLLFGLGALGGFYAFILGRNSGVSLTVVARSNYEEVKANGLKIESENHGNHTVRIDNVIRSLAEVDSAPEYIVCTTKAIDLESVPPLFKDVATQRTTFVIIQNGVGNEDPFRRKYPKCTILSCVSWVGARQEQLGLIKHFAIEDTRVGLFRNADLDEAIEQGRLDRFADLLRAGRTPVSIEENIQVQRWEKVVWNAAWNSMSAITQVDSQTWLKSSDEAVTTIKRLMSEMVEVAKHCGLGMDDQLVDKFIDKMSNLQPVYGSMYADLKNGRPLEVEVLLGTPMKKAREFGIDAPVLSTFYSMITAIDGRLRQSKN